MADYKRALKWPVVGWIVADIVILIISYVGGVLQHMSSDVLSPLALAVGASAGYKIVRFKGNFVDVVVSGFLVGAVGSGLLYFELTFIRGINTIDVLPLSVLLFAMNLVGAVVGGGFALSK